MNAISAASASKRTGWQAMNVLLWVAGFLVLSVGSTLYLFTERTSELFAWTIAPPNNAYLTATFLGASYWASAVLEFTAARQRTWTHARIAVPAVLLFTFLTLIVTLLHLPLFHLGPPLGKPAGAMTVALTYFWLFVYISVPLVMSYLLVRKLRSREVDGPRTLLIPPVLRTGLGLQAVVMLVIGFCLLFLPNTAPFVWPWKLTPLTAQAIGAWLVSLAVCGFHATWENDLHRIRPAAVSMVVLGLLHLAAVARYAGDLNWARAGSWAYVLFLVSLLMVGGLLVLARQRRALRAAATA